MDGLHLSFRHRRPMLWVELAEPHRVKLMPGPDRLLYTLLGDRLHYAQLTHAVCEGCGAMHERSEACVLCGTRS